MTTKVEKFVRPCSYKVLPLVYDESLSYYESVCKLVDKVNEVVEAIDGIQIEVLDEAKAYTDNAIAQSQSEIDARIEQLNNLIDATTRQFNQQLAQIQSQYDTFTRNVNAQLTIFQYNLDQLDDKLDNEITAVNARTDLALEQLHDRIFDEISEDLLKNLVVTNYFTGLKVTVQSMFDYLAKLHVEDGITYSELADREKTYTELANLHISYTDLILHGDSLIV